MGESRHIVRSFLIDVCVFCIIDYRSSLEEVGVVVYNDSGVALCSRSVKMLELETMRFDFTWFPLFPSKFNSATSVSTTFSLLGTRTYNTVSERPSPLCTTTANFRLRPQMSPAPESTMTTETFCKGTVAPVECRTNAAMLSGNSLVVVRYWRVIIHL